MPNQDILQSFPVHACPAKPDRRRPPQVCPYGHTCTANARRRASAVRIRRKEKNTTYSRPDGRSTFPGLPAERKRGGPGGIIPPGGAWGGAPVPPTCPCLPLVRASPLFLRGVSGAGIMKRREIAHILDRGGKKGVSSGISLTFSRRQLRASGGRTRSFPCRMNSGACIWSRRRGAIFVVPCASATAG